MFLSGATEKQNIAVGILHFETTQTIISVSEWLKERERYAMQIRLPVRRDLEGDFKSKLVPIKSKRRRDVPHNKKGWDARYFCLCHMSFSLVYLHLLRFAVLRLFPCFDIKAFLWVVQDVFKTCCFQSFNDFANWIFVKHTVWRFHFNQGILISHINVKGASFS